MSASKYLHPPDNEIGEEPATCHYCGEVITAVDQECNELANGWVCES